MKLLFSVSGTKDDQSFTGTVSIPEFMHDQDDDEYVFNINCETHSSEIKKYFVPSLKLKLKKFQPDLIQAHEKDVQHNTN